MATVFGVFERSLAELQADLNLDLRKMPISQDYYKLRDFCSLADGPVSCELVGEKVLLSFASDSPPSLSDGQPWGDRFEAVIELDPARSHLVSKLVTTVHHGESAYFRYTTAVEEYVQRSDLVWLPSRVRTVFEAIAADQATRDEYLLQCNFRLDATQPADPVLLEPAVMVVKSEDVDKQIQRFYVIREDGGWGEPFEDSVEARNFQGELHKRLCTPPQSATGWLPVISGLIASATVFLLWLRRRHQPELSEPSESKEGSNG